MERNLARFIKKEVSSEYREGFDSSTSTTDTPTQTRRIRADTSSISIIFLKAEKGNESDAVRNGHTCHTGLLDKSLPAAGPLSGSEAPRPLPCVPVAGALKLA